VRLTRWLYLRLLGAVTVVAVGGFWLQLPGLVGSHGIAPVADTLRALHQAPGLGFFDVPTLTWLSASDAMLHLLAFLGVAAGLSLMLGFAPRLALAVLWASWLSLVTVCAPFLNFQWDVMLLEVAFFSIPFAPPGWRPRLATEPEPTHAARFLLAWLSCKVTLASGLIKLLSGDPKWRDLTALSLHWWTQPLPSWTSWAFDAIPMAGQRALCLGMFVAELVIPLLALGPRRLKLVAAAGLIGLQAMLIVSGNYSFYNHLTLVLALPLLDDAALRWLAPKALKLPELPPQESPRSPRWQAIAAAVVVMLGIGVFVRRALRHAPVAPVLEAIAPFETINGYGAFAWMSRARPEITVEGSADGTTWKPYLFKDKPGPLDRRPEFVAPYQPRLDWQLWFAALSSCDDNPWFVSFQRHLLLGTPEVLALLGPNPFPDAPPNFVRTTIAPYTFAHAPGVWWEAGPGQPYCPELSR
jgi:hypothetical protein